MNTEFSIFRVITGKEERATEWMETLVQRRSDCIETLERESMLHESVFKTYYGGRMYLAWFSLQGEGAQSVETSDHDVDKVHLAFWKECIDTDWPEMELDHVVSFYPAIIERQYSALA